MKKTLIFFLLLFATTIIWAHEKHDNHKDSLKTNGKSDSLTTVNNVEKIIESHVQHELNQNVTNQKSVTASISDFPSLHPLIVHFPIVLLIVGFILALVNIIFLKKEFDWVISFFLLFGFIGALAAGKWLHPHTHEISEYAESVLAQHDKWADLTIYLSFTGLIVQVLNQFLKPKRWRSIIVAMILFTSAFAVSRAGHYGAQLVHLEGIGVQGKFLESGHEH